MAPEETPPCLRSDLVQDRGNKRPQVCGVQVADTVTQVTGTKAQTEVIYI
jgi:hypothetical protein